MSVDSDAQATGVRAISDHRRRGLPGEVKRDDELLKNICPAARSSAEWLSTDQPSA